MHAADIFLFGILNQMVQRRQVGLGEGDGQFADPGETESELFTKRVPQLVTPPLQASLQRLGVGVVAAVDDAAVGLAGSESGFGLPFQECDREFVAAELVGDGRSDDAPPPPPVRPAASRTWRATAPIRFRRGSHSMIVGQTGRSKGPKSR